MLIEVAESGKNSVRIRAKKCAFRSKKRRLKRVGKSDFCRGYFAEKEGKTGTNPRRNRAQKPLKNQLKFSRKKGEKKMKNRTVLQAEKRRICALLTYSGVRFFAGCTKWNFSGKKSAENVDTEPKTWYSKTVSLYIILCFVSC